MSILDLTPNIRAESRIAERLHRGLEPEPAGRLSESDVYRAVTQAASDAIIVIDEQSTILFANRSIERILGYRAEELVGST